MKPTLRTINSQAEKIKLYTDKTLSNRFKIPVFIDDETARVIAMRTIFKEDEAGIWLNGKQVTLKNLALELKLVYLQSNIQLSSETPKTQEQD